MKNIGTIILGILAFLSTIIIWAVFTVLGFWFAFVVVGLIINLFI
jgi:hypothetical protein